MMPALLVRNTNNSVTNIACVSTKMDLPNISETSNNDLTEKPVINNDSNDNNFKISNDFLNLEHKTEISDSNNIISATKDNFLPVENCCKDIKDISQINNDSGNNKTTSEIANNKDTPESFQFCLEIKYKNINELDKTSKNENNSKLNLNNSSKNILTPNTSNFIINNIENFSNTENINSDRNDKLQFSENDIINNKSNQSSEKILNSDTNNCSDNKIEIQIDNDKNKEDVYKSIEGYQIFSKLDKNNCSKEVDLDISSQNDDNIETSTTNKNSWQNDISEDTSKLNVSEKETKIISTNLQTDIFQQISPKIEIIANKNVQINDVDVNNISKDENSEAINKSNENTEKVIIDTLNKENNLKMNFENSSDNDNFEIKHLMDEIIQKTVENLQTDTSKVNISQDVSNSVSYKDNNSEIKNLLEEIIQKTLEKDASEIRKISNNSITENFENTSKVNTEINDSSNKNIELNNCCTELKSDVQVNKFIKEILENILDSVVNSSKTEEGQSKESPSTSTYTQTIEDPDSIIKSNTALTLCNKLSSKNKAKLLTFLHKNNLTEIELMTKLKHMKRNTKDKTKLNIVLSHKLNKNYLKTMKQRRLIKNKRMKKLKLNRKLQKDSDEDYTSYDTENSEDKNIISREDETKNEDIPKDIFPNLYGDDDIRNKIKMQLELLRRNTKKPTLPEIIESEPITTKNEENTSKCFKIPEKSSNIVVKNDLVNKTLSTNLSEVLLSNEGDLAIVNVVGGYISDEEKEEPKQTKVEETVKIVNKSTNYANRGISITDKILMDLSLENHHVIKPTKTTDITKIKGWRTKKFNIDNDDSIKSNSSELLKDDINVVDNIPPLVPIERIYSNSSIENPIPGTSSGYFQIGSETLQKESELLKLPEEINNKKSAFVSDYLETFLSTNSKLQISYEVPKLVAEEAITKPESEMPVSKNDYLSVVEKTTYKPKYATKTVKPKTLAEKRRMLELDRQNQLLQDMEANESTYLKQLEYCDKRNKNHIAKDIQENLITGDTPFSRLCWNLATKISQETQQYALVNGEKIRINGSSGGKDIIIANKNLNNYRNVNKTGFLLNKFSKPSLIKVDETKELNTSVKYNPGPLSRKHKLAKQTGSWECRVLKMPKIKLEVYPEQSKPLPIIAQQYLQLCRHDQYNVNKNWASFAVCAVKTKDPSKQNKFEFEIPYANKQNRLLVRKTVPKNINPIVLPQKSKTIKFPDVNVEDTIKDVMSDLLNCVANQELENKIIKDDPDLNILFKTKEKQVERPPSPINPLVQAIIKRPNAKRNKTTLELRRLNVKVIEVDVKEEESEPENCGKDYCKLGCVCKSLRGATALVPEHCGRVECMLECSCSFNLVKKVHHAVTLPAGTDILSPSTVVRLQDEAKRNLAKEEREFTQTVIKANNQTIMVGGGARERTRRVSKVPKKYTNFAVDKPTTKGLSIYDKMMSVGTLEIEPEELNFDKIIPPKPKILPETDSDSRSSESKRSVPIWINKNKPKLETNFASDNIFNNCYVKLNKMKLKNVVPWCMVHNLYKCHCGGKITNIAPKPTITPEISKLSDADKEEYIAYNPRFGSRYQPESSSTINSSDIADKYCARTKALATNYYHVRNKSQRFKADFALMKEKEDKNIVDFANYKPALTTNKNKRKSVDQYEMYENRDDNNLINEQNLLVPIKQKIIRRKISNDYIEIEKDPLYIEEKKPVKHKIYDFASQSEDMQTKRKKSKTKNNDDRIETKTLLLQQMQERFDNTEKKKVTLPQNMRKLTKILNIKKQPPLQQMKKIENTHIVSSSAFIDYERSYMGLLTPSKEWLKRFHNMLNPNDHTIVHQIRLLEWATMVRRYDSSTLQLWFNTKKYNNIILTEDRHRPSNNHLNVKMFKNIPSTNFKLPDIISSLILRKLPGAAKKDTETYLILVYNGTFWEARGTIVLTDTSEVCKQKIGHKPTPTKMLTPHPFLATPVNKKLAVESKSGTLIIKSTPSMSVEVINKENVPSAEPITTTSTELEIISLSSSPPKSIEIIEEPTIEIKTREIDIGNILAPLPTGGGLNRWFMLILENDFSVLRISFSNFHIKYTHLQAALNMASKSQKTVRIKTPPMKHPDIGENFSIYACPDNNQRIFFGPYGSKNDHGLETFRYVNGKLVNTKIYNKMRGSPQRKTSGYWFTHSSTMNNNLHLEPNYDDASSGSECSTACTTIDNVTKPQIELVDLTGNDSDSDLDIQIPKHIDNENIDPLINVLSADFTKKVTNDITIEPVNPPVVPVLPNKVEIEISSFKNEPDKQQNEISIPNDRKRKSVSELTEEPVIKQPTLIDSIDLDDDEDDEEMPILEPYNKEQNIINSPDNQMPPLHPVHTAPASKEKGRQRCLYVITNIPGIGYFEIFFEKTRLNRQSMYTLIRGVKTQFQTINNAIKYLHHLFTKYMYFMPKTLKVKFSIVDSAEPPDMPKFKNEFLNRYYMLCERGIFNILSINARELDQIGFDDEEIQKLLSYKCDLLIGRNIKQLGTFLFGPERAKKMTYDDILSSAPAKIKLMETKEANLIDEKNNICTRQQNLLVLINDLLRDVPDYVSKSTQQKIYYILRQKSATIVDDNETIDYLNKNPSELPQTSTDTILTTNTSKSDDHQSNRSLLTNPLTGKIVTTLADQPMVSLLSNTTSLVGKTINPLPPGKICKIVDGKIIVADKIQSTATSVLKPRVAQPKTISTPYPVNVMSQQQLQSILTSSLTENNSKFELIVPITGLQSPATVVGLPSINTSLIPVTSVLGTKLTSPTSLLNKSNPSPKIVDLTDD